MTRGVLYYISSKERVEPPLDAALREKTLGAIRLIRDLSARPSPPEPLPPELRHRCPGCSLVTVCQPEETLFQIGFGNVQVSTQALECLLANEIPVVYLSGYGRFIGTLQPAPAKNVSLRQEQYRRFGDVAEAFRLSREVVRAKLINQRALLMRSLRSRGDPEEAEASRGSDETAARDMAELLWRLDRVTEVESVLGLEGQGAALYFGEFARFLKAHPPPNLTLCIHPRPTSRGRIEATWTVPVPLPLADDPGGAGEVHLRGRRRRPARPRARFRAGARLLRHRPGVGDFSSWLLS